MAKAEEVEAFVPPPSDPYLVGIAHGVDEALMQTAPGVRLYICLILS